MSQILKSSTPPHSVAPEARLKIIKGPHKGASYKLVAGKITIGRSSDNDITLMNDNKCSRKQAVVSLDSHNNYSIKDLSKKSSIKVNNMVKIQSDLQDGDIIQLGSSVLQFEFKGPTNTTAHKNMPAVRRPVAPLLSNKGPANPLPVLSFPEGASDNNLSSVPAIPDLKQDYSLAKPQLNPSSPLHPVASSPSTPLNMPHKKRKQQSSFIPRIVLIVVALGGVWLFLGDSGSKKEEEDKLRTALDREESVKTLAELKEKEMEKRSKNMLSNYKHAQFAYIKGVRDYRKGVYNRAIESFRVCKTLYPQHDLCASYLKKSQAKNQQLIQAWMMAGKDYREKRRFIPCMSSFKNVMMAIKDKHNLTYKEAHENFKICQIQHEDRY